MPSWHRRRSRRIVLAKSYIGWTNETVTGKKLKRILLIEDLPEIRIWFAALLHESFGDVTSTSHHEAGKTR